MGAIYSESETICRITQVFVGPNCVLQRHMHHGLVRHWTQARLAGECSIRLHIALSGRRDGQQFPRAEKAYGDKEAANKVAVHPMHQVSAEKAAQQSRRNDKSGNLK